MADRTSSGSRSSSVCPTATVVLAAGYGTRMRSKLPKVLHRLAGRPMVAWAVDTARAVSDRPPVLVVGHGAQAVQAALGDQVEYVAQPEMLGTGHAVMQARAVLEGQVAQVIVLYADMPLLQAPTLQALRSLFEAHRGQRPALAMLTVERPDPQGFGRVVRDSQGRVRAVVEEADCTPEQLTLRELNAGIYCFDAAWLWENLSRLRPSAQGEYYLTDLVGMAADQGRAILTMSADPEEVHGVNNRLHLAQAARILRRRINERHMLAGVTLVDPETTYIDDTVTIGPDTVILPGCHLEGATHIGADCVIGPHSRLVDTVVGDRCRVTYSVLEGARMDAGSEIGPFSHLRPGAHLGEGVHMGNFGEVKNSYLGPGVKMGHFSYVGDATVGPNVNIGAGTITCNYDGAHKHRTVLEEGVFLGSGTLLVAPLHLGRRAHTGAGSVVTRDVPPETLVYGVPARPHGRSPLAEAEEPAAAGQAGRTDETDPQ